MNIRYFPRNPFLFIAPALYLVWEAVLYANRGPNWIMFPQDLGYNYLFNGLNLLNGDPLGSLIHPALTTIGFIAGVTWLAHRLFGSGPIDVAAVHDPEFYFAFSVHSTTLLTAICLYLMGRWAYRGLRSPWLVLLLQAFIFLPRPFPSMIMNSFASPESMLVMAALLMTGLTLRTLDGELADAKSRNGYAIWMAIIAAGAVATKFIAVPMLLLPFLVLPGIRARAVYCLSLGAALALAFSPIVLIRAHRAQFIQDMVGLRRSAELESSFRGVGDSIFGIVAQFQPLNGEIPAYTLLLVLGLSALLFLVVCRPLFRQVQARSPWELRLFTISQIVSAVALLFILTRPKVHYLVPFLMFVGMGTTLLVSMLGRQMALVQGVDFGAVRVWAIAIGAAVFGAFFGYNAYSAKGLPFVNELRSVALQIREYSFRAPGNNAIVTAIQASSIPTALYHANQTSGSLWRDRFAEVLPPNHFEFDPHTHYPYSYRHGPVSVSDLLEIYDRVMFWTKRDRFSSAPSPENPSGEHQLVDAVWHDIRVAAAERLSEVEGLAIQPRFDVRTTPEKNRASGWTVSDCKPDSKCLTFAVERLDRKVITHFRFLADPDQFAAMPRRWTVEGSDNGSDWFAIENFVDLRPWTPFMEVDWPPHYQRLEEARQNRVYRVNNDRYYPHVRLVFPQQGTSAALMPGQVSAYSGGGCAPERRVLTVRTAFVSALDSVASGTETITGSWEEVGKFPRVLTVASPLMTPGRYLLGTGNDGVNGGDSKPRMPRSWVLQGSRDGRDWIDLDRQSEVPPWSSDEVRAYGIGTTSAFAFFRLIVERTDVPGVVRLYKFRIEGSYRDGSGPRNTFTRGGAGLSQFSERGGPFPATLQAEFEVPHTIASYRLTVGPFGADGSTRMPKDWRLLGSEDGETWHLADSRTGEIGWRNGEHRAYTLARPGRYKYMRLEVSDVAGDQKVLRLSLIGYYAPRETPPKGAC